ncbi:hypothetical protein [Dasineura jujubifolia toursvirus 2a]|nr:hypothetical protein [Dasineura jujubifolia toursvirus 2a]
MCMLKYVLVFIKTEMLNDDLIELYHLLVEESDVRDQIKQLHNSIKDLKEEMDEIKTRIAKELIEINHKYAKYKNMEVAVITKADKSKLKKEELEQELENILSNNENSPINDTVTKILEALKPKEVGTFTDKIIVKLKKETSE